MTHSQESRVSGTQDSYRLSEESRSSVSALVSRLNSSALGVDHNTDNEKLRGDSAKMKDQKLQDPFPWMTGFCNLCQAAVGSRNVRHLENLMNVYLENVTPNVRDCYTKPNRAAKLKKSMNDTLIFFHLFYQEIKETLEHSFYLEKMTTLVSMFMDMEIKASLRGKESLKKVASRLTSSLYIFLDNSEEHMLDAILMTKFVHKNYREICHPLLWKLLHSICTYPMYEMLYVRCLLTFKLWKKIVPDAEERKRINKTAMQKLQTPPHLIENIKAMGNVLPRIPKTKKNITLFLMQSNFNLKNACQEFLKSVKKPQKGAYNQGLGVEIDKPLFFVNHSGYSPSRLTEKEDESDSGCSNNLINSIWSSISTVKSNAPQTKRLNDLTPEEPRVVDSQETPKKNKKAVNKKKGKKKKKVVKCVGKKKKKKSIGSSEKSGKQAKKLSKLKGKKKKKKKMTASIDHSQIKPKQVTSLQVEDRNQLKVLASLTQIEECTQVVVRPNSPVVGEHNQIRVINSEHLRADSSLDEESQKAQPKQASPNKEENVASKDNEALSQVGESGQTLGKKCDKSVDQQPRLEESNHSSVKKSTNQAEESDEVTSNKVASMAEECGLRKVKSILSEGESGALKVNRVLRMSDELKTAKNTQLINKSDDVNQYKAKAALLHRDDCSQGKVGQTSPLIDEYSQSKNEQAPGQLEESDLLNIKQAFFHIGDNDQVKFKQAMLQIGEYDEIKVQKVMEQFEASERTKIKQAMYQFTECDDKIIEAKIEPQLEIPKTEKCDSPPSSQIQESEFLSRSMEPPVKKVKLEIVTNVCVDSSFEAENSVASETINNVTDVGGLSSEKTVELVNSNDLPKESILSDKEINAKCAPSEEAECVFDNYRQDLFTVDSSKDPLSEKPVDCSINSIPVITDESKPSDLSLKSKTVENSTPVSVYAVEVCDSSLKQEICDNSETAESGSLDMNKTGQMESYSDVEIVDEFKPQEAGKCDVSTSEEEIVLGDDGELLPRQTASENIFDTGNEDLVIEMLGYSGRPYSMSRGVMSVESMEFETVNPPVNDDLEPEPDNYYSKSIKDDNSSLYSSHSPYGFVDWIYERNTSDLYRPILPAVVMEGEEYDEVTESDMSKSFESTTPKPGKGKVSYDDVRSYSYQAELCASTSGRHNSQGCLMLNSSESGSGSTETSPHLTSSASGSSSPHSESAIDTVEGVQESMETCDNLMKTSERGVSCERVPDVTSLNYYTSNYPKSPEIASCTKDVGYNAQVNFTSKIGSHQMDNARVVVETMKHSVLNQAINDRLSTTSSRPETSSRRNISEASSQHSPLKRKKSSKLLPEQTVESQSSPGKHESGEAGNYAAQSRATLRGRGRRGRPPSRGRGVSSTVKLPSDSKTTRKHGYSGKGRNDPEFQIASMKKSQQYDPPLTRSISKKFGISETDNMFDRL